MHVGAGHHEYLVAAQSMESSEYIAGQVGAREVTDVEGAVGIRPRDSDKDAGHLSPFEFFDRIEWL